MTLSHRFHTRYDAVVIGARPAGAATAMLLARSGLSVLAVDKSGYGTDALSTHALLRVGVAQLQRWGLLETIRAAGTPTVRQTSFHYGPRTLVVPIKPKGGIDGLYAPRRTVLDAVLVDAAREAGADVRHHVKLVDLVWSETGRVIGVVLSDAQGERHTVRAGIVIGADGVRSSVAERVGAAAYRHAEHTTATIYGYWSGLTDEGYEYYFDHGVSAGVFPTNGGACVFVSMPPARFHAGGGTARAAELYTRVVAGAAPALHARLERATRMGALRSFPGTPGYFRQAQGPGWALVGDAGYFKDPATAHGISDALRDAELVARAVVSGSPSALADYQDRRDQLSQALFLTTDRIASFDWSLDEIAALHLALSDSMRAEVAMVSQLSDLRVSVPAA